MELLKDKVAEILGVSKSAKESAYRMLIAKVLEALEVTGAIKIKGLGVFQFKTADSFTEEGEEGEPGELILSSMPADLTRATNSAFISLDISGFQGNDLSDEESLFSDGDASVIDTGGLMRNIESRAVELIASAEKFDEYDIWDNIVDSLSESGDAEIPVVGETKEIDAEPEDELSDEEFDFLTDVDKLIEEEKLAREEGQTDEIKDIPEPDEEKSITLPEEEKSETEAEEEEISWDSIGENLDLETEEENKKEEEEVEWDWGDEEEGEQEPEVEESIEDFFEETIIDESPQDKFSDPEDKGDEEEEESFFAEQDEEEEPDEELQNDLSEPEEEPAGEDEELPDEIVIPDLPELEDVEEEADEEPDFSDILPPEDNEEEPELTGEDDSDEESPEPDTGEEQPVAEVTPDEESEESKEPEATETTEENGVDKKKKEIDESWKEIYSDFEFQTEEEKPLKLKPEKKTTDGGDKGKILWIVGGGVGAVIVAALLYLFILQPADDNPLEFLEKPGDTVKTEEPAEVKETPSEDTMHAGSEENTTDADQGETEKNVEQVVHTPDSEAPAKESSMPSGLYLDSADIKLVKNLIFSNGSRYLLQISSLRDKAAAEREAKRLRRKGEQAYIVESYIPARKATFFRIKIGFFNTIQEAEAYKNSR